MDNLYRRNQILDIIRTEGATTQTALRRKLAELGIRVTQATVSRDMEELGVVKTREGYRLPAAAAAQSSAPPAQPVLPVILKEFVREVTLASNLVIVKTHPGNAHSVAVALDNARWMEILGSVAGDDTIFLAAADAKRAARIRNKIRAALME
jgi:transcriptional regulator of arginine metabolism